MDAGTKDIDRLILVLILGVFLPLLDISILSVCIPELMRVFNTSAEIVQRVNSCYALSSAITLTICAWLTHRYTPRKVWIWSLGIFLLGSALCGMAGSINALILFRVIQGVGAGLMLPTMLTIIVLEAGPDQTKAALAKASVVSVVAPILGPVLASLLLEAVGWRAVFYVNIPFCMAAMYLASKYLSKKINNEALSSFDLPGFFMLSIAMIFIVLGVSGREESIIMLGPAFIFLGLYYWYSSKISKKPLVNLTIFTFPKCRNSALLLGISSFVLFASLFLLPIYFQTSLKMTNLQTGILLAIQGVGMLIARKYLSWIAARIKERTIFILAVIAVSTGTGIFAKPAYVDGLLFSGILMFFRGAGLGILTISSMSGIYNGLSKELIAHASVASRIISQISAATGSAIASLLMSYFLKDHLDNMGEGVNSSLGVLALISILAILPSIAMTARSE